MSQFTNLVARSLLLPRVADNDDNFDDNFRSNPNTKENYISPNHRGIAIGVIVAIIVAGLAIIGGVTTFLIKRRQRLQKRGAALSQQAENEIEWYGPGDGSKGISGRERGVEMTAKKVAFVEEVPPPSYQSAVGREGVGEAK